MAERPKDSRRVAGGTRERKGWERQASAAGTEETRPKAEGLLKEVLRRENLLEALKRVRSNRGAPGVDGMTVEALSPYLKGEWPRIREELLGGTYVPSPVRQVTIPKPDGCWISHYFTRWFSRRSVMPESVFPGLPGVVRTGQVLS
jgi:RNA-directed DNA polymerase